MSYLQATLMKMYEPMQSQYDTQLGGYPPVYRHLLTLKTFIHQTVCSPSPPPHLPPPPSPESSPLLSQEVLSPSAGFTPSKLSSLKRYRTYNCVCVHYTQVIQQLQFNTGTSHSLVYLNLVRLNLNQNVSTSKFECQIFS